MLLVGKVLHQRASEAVKNQPRFGRFADYEETGSTISLRLVHTGGLVRPDQLVYRDPHTQTRARSSTHTQFRKQVMFFYTKTGRSQKERKTRSAAVAGLPAQNPTWSTTVNPPRLTQTDSDPPAHSTQHSSWGKPQLHNQLLGLFAWQASEEDASVLLSTSQSPSFSRYPISQPGRGKKKLVFTDIFTRLAEIMQLLGLVNIVVPVYDLARDV